MRPALTSPADRFMTIRGLIANLTQQEDLNFLLTNRIPRAALTRFMGWFSKIEQPLIRDCSIACWRLFSDLDLSEAKATSFKSLHDCFTRELRPGLRPPDPDPSIVASPSDGIIRSGAAIADRAPVDLERCTRPPFAHLEPYPELSDGLSPDGGRHHFFDAISFSIALSSIASASSFLSLAFSASGALSRLASDTSRPPYLAFHL